MVVACNYHVGLRRDGRWSRQNPIAIAMDNVRLSEDRLRAVIKDELKILSEMEWRPQAGQRSAVTVQRTQVMAREAGLYDAVETLMTMISDETGDRRVAAELLRRTIDSVYDSVVEV